MFDNLLSLIPASIKSSSGAVFNSGRAAFSSPVPLYILGLNPGGSPEKHQKETADFHTQKVMRRPDEWSEYRDESWNGRQPGTAGLQPRVLHVLKGLNLHPYRVPSSNIVFQRTTSEKDIGAEFESLAEQCWPFHQRVIDQLEVRVILCFGKRAGNWIKRKLNANELIDEFEEQNNRRWKTQAFVNHQRIKVVIATHPSRVDWTRPASDPTPLLQRVMCQS